MSVKIRLKRMGAKKNPFYRFVVTDSRMPRDGRFVEEIGYYRPTGSEEKISVDDEKAIDWLNKGAKPSETVRNLFKKAGIRKS